MIAKWLDPKREAYDLDSLLEDAGIPVSHRHHALHDAVMTAKLYFHYLDRVTSRHIHSLGDLYAYLSRH
jgi:DNA polymerase-3 subunit epsilon